MAEGKQLEQYRDVSFREQMFANCVSVANSSLLFDVMN